MLMNRFDRGPLLMPAGVPSGSGGGEAPPLTMDSVLAEVNKALDAKLGGAFDRFKKEGLGAAIDEKLAPITTSLGNISGVLEKLTAAPNPPVAGGNNPQLKPEENVLLKNLQETTKKQGEMIERLTNDKKEAEARAERSERHSVIRTALGNMHFISDVAANTAFTIVEPHIKRQDNNELIGGLPNGDLYPVDAFVKDYLTKEHSYLLRASGNTGSGAPANSGVRMGVKADLSDIKVGMKPETRDSVVASISAALANQ